MSDPKSPSHAEMLRAAFEPFQTMQGEMTRIQGEMTKMMESFWSGQSPMAGLPKGASLPAMRPAHPLAANQFAPMMGLPACDVTESPEAYRITLEAAGLTAKDIEVTAEHNVLSISGEKSEEKDLGGANYYLSERRFGRFQRAFPLPLNVDVSAIKTEAKNGVITITLPKKTVGA